MSDERRHDIAAVALLLLIEAVFFADVIAGRGVFFFRDFSRYYFPIKKMQRDIVLGGEFPWWTRAYSAGQPLAANPEHETFYPLNWLILLPNYVAALHLQTLVHVAIALAGMYALLRSLKLRAFASFIGAVSFGLGGALLSKTNMSPFLFSAAWVPLTCLFTRNFLRTGNRRQYVWAVACLAMQLLIGEPTTVMQTVLIAGGYAMWSAYQSKSWSALWRIVAIGTAALLLAAVQIVPGLDFVRDSARSRPFSLPAVGQWSMPWAKLLELVFPNIFGHHFAAGTTLFWGANLYGDTSVPFLLSVYPGLLITLLAIAGMISRRRGAFIVALSSCITIILAAGRHTPLLHALYATGLVKTLRYPEKFAMTLVFILTVFGAYCVEALQDGDDRVRRAALWIAAAIASMSVALFVASATPAYGEMLTRIFDLQPIATPIVAHVSHVDWGIATLRALALLALIATARFATRRVWMLAAAALLVIDLARLAPEISPRLPSSLYDEPPIPAPLRDNRFRLFQQADLNLEAPISATTPATAPTSIGMRFRDVPEIQYGYRNALFPFFGAAWQVQTVLEHDVDATNLLPTVDFTRAVQFASRSGGGRAIAAAMAMSNARFRAVLRRAPRQSSDPRLVQPVAFVETTRQPRYYFGSPVVEVRDVDDFASKLASAAYPHSVAFVAAPLSITGSGTVRSAVESTNSASIDVEANGPALLVMSVTPNRYWRIFVDGVPARPIVTNVGYQSVVVPSGRHQVTMRYRNPVVIVSALVSILMAVAMAWIACKRQRLAVIDAT